MPLPLVEVLEDNRLTNLLKSIANVFRLNDGVAKSYLENDLIYLFLNDIGNYVKYLNLREVPIEGNLIAKFFIKYQNELEQQAKKQLKKSTTPLTKLGLSILTSNRVFRDFIFKYIDFTNQLFYFSSHYKPVDDKVRSALEVPDVFKNKLTNDGTYDKDKVMELVLELNQTWEDLEKLYHMFES